MLLLSRPGCRREGRRGVPPRCSCGHALTELCRSDDPPSDSEGCDCCRCSAKRQTPVTISVAILCCCGAAGNDGGGHGGESTGGSGTKGTGTGTGTVGGIGWTSGPATWGQPDKCGWQLWGEPFTLPVTRANWPARYTGALDPSTHADPVLAVRDVLECRRRLDTLDLLNGMSLATEEGYFKELRAECVRLVEGWPAIPNYAVGIGTSDDGSAAPQLSLSLVSQLQMSALSPYMARVLGLYFVDTDAEPDEEYQYCVVGVWAKVVPPQVQSPGGAPAGSIARGKAQFGGMTISANPDVSHLFAWQSDASSSLPPAQIQGVPAAVAAAFTAATSTLSARRSSARIARGPGQSRCVAVSAAAARPDGLHHRTHDAGGRGRTHSGRRGHSHRVRRRRGSGGRQLLCDRPDLVSPRRSRPSQRRRSTRSRSSEPEVRDRPSCSAAWSAHP